MKSIFITGVDTDIGKTFISIGLCLKMAQEGLKTGYFKPFQSGAYKKNGVLIAPDVFEFEKYDSILTSCSYLLEGEVSPFLASKIHNVEFDFEKVAKDFEDFSKMNDFTIIEGAGGLFCPIKPNKTFCDLIKFLNQEIIIVSTPNLGRINHTLMTIQCARDFDIKIKGLIINKMPQNPTESQKNFVDELKEFTDCEILAIIPEMKKPSKGDVLEAFKNLNL